MFDVTIIGAGPAGVSAALYARRANLSVLILHNGAGALEKAHKIENYYGFPNGISGLELYENGIKQAENLEITVQKEEVTHIEMNADFAFTLKTEEQKIQTKSVVIATGNKKLRPAIKGLADLEGKGVSYCAICDAFFYRKKDVVVIGDGNFAVSEAQDLLNVASSLKILTDGKDSTYVKSLSNGKYEVIDKKIIEIQENPQTNKVDAVIFEDKSQLKVDGVFVALGEAGAANFAKKLGLFLNGDSIKVNEKMETNIPGIFSCGNSTGGLLQISKAVYEGTLAGLSAIEYIRKKAKEAK
ncbi:NAD(P)/FAD-dependent oxidoreductase [Treponema pectinovorum]|uniref:NAD(P)/FAD-dependent oxidoreductase n=1 Tax=Treponema pectinovorum TaxID=164 RepID=UPI0011C84770|nr:NAD(P)/FAD-dependent oxidoreductase [Treponema pectinovorum]